MRVQGKRRASLKYFRHQADRPSGRIFYRAVQICDNAVLQPGEPRNLVLLSSITQALARTRVQEETLLTYTVSSIQAHAQEQQTSDSHLSAMVCCCLRSQRYRYHTPVQKSDSDLFPPIADGGGLPLTIVRFPTRAAFRPRRALPAPCLHLNPKPLGIRDAHRQQALLPLMTLRCPPCEA